MIAFYTLLLWLEFSIKSILLIQESEFHLIAEMVFMPLEFRDLINFLSLGTHFISADLLKKLKWFIIESRAIFLFHK